MKTRPLIVAGIPIKTHSERVPGKNFAAVGGKPLYRHIIDHAVASNYIDAIIVDTDSEEVLRYCQRFDLPTFHSTIRKPELAADSANGNDLLAQTLRDAESLGLQPDILVQLFATAPGMTAAIIDEALVHLVRHSYFDSVFTAAPVDAPFAWCDGAPVNYDPLTFGRTQDNPRLLYQETAGLYAIRTQSFRARPCRIGLRPFPLMVDAAAAVDIDTPMDLEKASHL